MLLGEYCICQPSPHFPTFFSARMDISIDGMMHISYDGNILGLGAQLRTRLFLIHLSLPLFAQFNHFHSLKYVYVVSHFVVCDADSLGSVPVTRFVLHNSYQKRTYFTLIWTYERRY